MRPVVLVFAAACGGPFADDVSPLDAAPFRPDATTDASFGDGASDADADAGVVFNGGGPFMCGDCVCDGTLYSCDHGGGGGPAPLDDAAVEASACDDGSACVRIPIECLPKPSCDCLVPEAGSCWCSIDPSGNGLVIDCAPTP